MELENDDIIVYMFTTQPEQKFFLTNVGYKTQTKVIFQK